MALEKKEGQLGFCAGVCPWVLRQIKQVSTWRGLVILGGVIATTVNPALGAAIVKFAGAIVGVLDIAQNEAK
jgi:copper chaperone CopZ